METAYIVITFIIYIIALIVWLAAGTTMADEHPKAAKEDWRLWRGIFVIGLFTLWTWPVAVPLAVLWFIVKSIKDALFAVKVIKKGGYDA